MISIWTEILHMQIIHHRLIYNYMFEHLRLKNKSGISCKIKNFVVFVLKTPNFPSMYFIWVTRDLYSSMIIMFTIVYQVGCVIKKTVNIAG